MKNENTRIFKKLLHESANLDLFKKYFFGLAIRSFNQELYLLQHFAFLLKDGKSFAKI
tara:strand:+ start:471 stop:644 length:174 start_codon:yes stop_codon:yes gene_type:complete